VHVNEPASVSAFMNMVQSNVVKKIPLLTSYIVDKVHPVSKFDLASMVGYFNSPGARFRVDCFNNVVSEIDAKKHISSPDDMHGKSFPCLSMSTFEKYHEIHDRTLKMLSRKSQGQIKTNLDRMHTYPCMWWIRVSNFRKESLFTTPGHPIYYEDKKTHLIH
jgi:hypothetical protein